MIENLRRWQWSKALKTVLLIYDMPDAALAVTGRVRSSQRLNSRLYNPIRGAMFPWITKKCVAMQRGQVPARAN
jgi:hypothetical protein